MEENEGAKMVLGSETRSEDVREQVQLVEVFMLVRRSGTCKRKERPGTCGYFQGGKEA
jgi:hypothetical protein